MNVFAWIKMIPNVVLRRPVRLDRVHKIRSGTNSNAIVFLSFNDQIYLDFKSSISFKFHRIPCKSQKKISSEIVKIHNIISYS